jgi:hypothetical protein
LAARLGVFQATNALEAAFMSRRVIGSLMTVGLFALAIAAPVQTARRTAVVPGFILAQMTQPPTASTKTSKTKVKKKKTGSAGTGTPSGTQSPPPARVGPPDPGKY